MENLCNNLSLFQWRELVVCSCSAACHARPALVFLQQSDAEMCRSCRACTACLRQFGSLSTLCALGPADGPLLDHPAGVVQVHWPQAPPLDLCPRRRSPAGTILLCLFAPAASCLMRKTSLVCSPSAVAGVSAPAARMRLAIGIQCLVHKRNPSPDRYQISNFQSPRRSRSFPLPS